MNSVSNSKRLSSKGEVSLLALKASLDQDLHLLRLPTLKKDVQAKLQAAEDIFGSNNCCDVPLQALQERTRLRAHSELKDLVQKYELIREDLQDEQRARRNAQIRSGQLERQVQQLLQQKKDLMDKRLAAEAALRRSEKERVRLADKKRVVEQRFNELLLAYRKIVKAYEALKESYAAYAASRQMTTSERFKHILTKVFAFTPPDHEPVAEAAPMNTGACKLCKSSELCNGFHRMSIGGLLCACGHREVDHEL